MSQHVRKKTKKRRESHGTRGSPKIGKIRKFRNRQQQNGSDTSLRNASRGGLVS